MYPHPYANTGISYPTVPGSGGFQGGMQQSQMPMGSAMPPPSASGTGLFPQFAITDPSKPHLGPQPSVALSMSLAQTQAPPVLGPSALPAVPSAIDYRSGALLGPVGAGPTPSTTALPTNFATPGGRYVAAVQAVEATVVADWSPPNACKNKSHSRSHQYSLTV
jgi:hypothetical protein